MDEQGTLPKTMNGNKPRIVSSKLASLLDLPTRLLPSTLQMTVNLTV